MPPGPSAVEVRVARLLSASLKQLGAQAASAPLKPPGGFDAAPLALTPGGVIIPPEDGPCPPSSGLSSSAGAPFAALCENRRGRISSVSSI